MTWLSLLALLPLLKEIPAQSDPAPGDPTPSTASADGAEAEPAAEEGEGERTEGGGRRDPRELVPWLGVQLDVASSYVFRGELQYGSPAIPSFQPSVWLDFAHLFSGELRLGLWSAFAMADRARVSRVAAASELDLTLTYSRSLARGWLEISGGFYYYMYPGEEEVDGEKELSLSLGLGNLPLSIGLTAALEVHPDLGLYLEPALGWEREFGAFTVGTLLVLGAGIARGEEASLEHLTLTASVQHTVGRLAFGVSVSYVLRLALPGLDFLERSLLFGLVSLSFDPSRES